VLGTGRPRRDEMETCGRRNLAARDGIASYVGIESIVHKLPSGSCKQRCLISAAQRLDCAGRWSHSAERDIWALILGDIRDLVARSRDSAMAPGWISASRHSSSPSLMVSGSRDDPIAQCCAEQAIHSRLGAARRVFQTCQGLLGAVVQLAQLLDAKLCRSALSCAPEMPGW